MARRIPLNLYLLRPGTSPAEAVLGYHPDETSPGHALADDAPEAWQRTWTLGDEGAVEAPLPQSADGPPSLLVRSAPATAGWQALLGELAPTVPVGDDQRNEGALLFQALGAHTVVWSFGNAWPMLDPERTVTRFGLRLGLNALLSTPEPSPPPARRRAVGVRGLTAAIRASVVRKSMVQTARPSAPSTMERVDQSSDAASMAELTTHHDLFGRISAGRSLRFEALVSGIDDLEKYATEAIRLFERDDYTKDQEYNWIDYMVPVVDRDVIDQVLDELWTKANAEPPLDLDLVWADTDPDTGTAPSFVYLPHEQATESSPRRPELTWPAARDVIRYRSPNASGHEALRTRLRFFHDDLTPASSTELWRLAVAQATVGADSYLVSDGEVWLASRTHIDDIDALLEPHVTVDPDYLPRYALGEKEEVYNERARGESGHFLLDKSLVRLPGQTPFEPCDLLSADGCFMHVKRKTASSTMSHVMTQALAAARLLRGSATARESLDAALTATKPEHPGLAELRAHASSFGSSFTGRVAIVIVGTWRNRPDVTQLPLLTRVALGGWLRDMPFEREIVLVGT